MNTDGPDDRNTETEVVRYDQEVNTPDDAEVLETKLPVVTIYGIQE